MRDRWDTVAVVRNRSTGFRHRLQWNRLAQAFSHTSTLEALGQSSSEALDSDEVTALLESWGQQDQTADGFEVLEADEHLLDVLMEGQEWHPLIPTRSRSGE